MRIFTFATVLILLFSFSISNPISAELVFRYDFESEQLEDVSGNNNLGELRGAPERVNGIMGMALKLDGAADQIFTAEILTGLPLKFMNNAFTEKSVMVWIKADDVAGNHTIFEEGGSGNGYGIRINAKKLEFSVTNANVQATITTDYDDTDNWHHIASVYDKGEFRIYVDGEQVANEKASFQQIGSHVNGASIGSTVFNDVWQGGEGAFFQGLIDEFAYYDNALTGEEISHAYLQYLAVDPGGKLTTRWGKLKLSQRMDSRNH